MSISLLTRQEFARLLQDRLIKAGEEQPLEIDAGQFTLVPRGGSEARPVPLGPFHQMYLATPHDLEFIVKQFVEFWKSSQSTCGVASAAAALHAHPSAVGQPRRRTSEATIVWTFVGALGLMMCGVIVLPFVFGLVMLGVALILPGSGGPVESPLRGPPPGSQSTHFVGGPGGGRRWFYDRQGRLPVGFAYATDEDWDDARPVLKELQPVFDRQAPQVRARGGEPLTLVVAKENYVVGALLVDAGKFVCAVKAVFVRQKGERLDWTDSYESDWIGVPRGTDPVKLGGEGQMALGLEVRQGLVLDAVALLVRPATGAESAEPVEPE
jgi:hypothetical protein